MPVRRRRSWRRHQMETFSALLAICAGNSPVAGEFPTQRPVARSFYVFFDLRLNKRLSKQWWGWWFGTLSCPLWRQCNGPQWVKILPVRGRKRRGPVYTACSMILLLMSGRCKESRNQQPHIPGSVKEGLMETSSNGNIFRLTGPLCGEFTGHRWIPLTKANDLELWWFHWSKPE